MCSGCFGEYEEDEYFERAAPGAQDTARNLPSGVGGEWHGICPEDQFEVLVGSERIVEIRWIDARRSGCQGWALDKQAARWAQKDDVCQRFSLRSARSYQTPMPHRHGHHAGPYSDSRWLLFLGLSVISLGAVIFWHLLT